MQGGTANTNANIHVFIATHKQQLAADTRAALANVTLHGRPITTIVITSERDLSTTTYRPVPELILVDHDFPRHLPKFLKKVRYQGANTEIILITPSPFSAIAMLKHRVTTFLEPVNTLTVCLDTVLRTLQFHVYLERDFARSIAHHFAQEMHRLQPIERQILQGIINGDTYATIMQRHQFTSMQIIEKHLYNLISRLWEPIHR